MASQSGPIINLDSFNADATASGQPTAKVREEEVFGASQEAAASSASYSAFSSQSTTQTPQMPPNNTFIGHDIESLSWGYDPNFGHYPLDPALAQPVFHQMPHFSIANTFSARSHISSNRLFSSMVIS